MMVSLKTLAQTQEQIVKNLKDLRLSHGLTQAGLAERSGVSLPTLRKFEQKNVISLESFVKLCRALGCLEGILKATQPEEQPFLSIDDVLEEEGAKKRQRGWKK